jgi:c-di-GMP-binding flagellar brake protein YcgR
MTPSSERRRYPRVSLNHVTVEVYSDAGIPDNPEFCFIINVSENGMLFKTDAHPNLYLSDKMLRLTFVIPENNVIIRTDADVIHISETDLSAYVGVQFKSMGSAEHKTLKEFVAKSAESNPGV